MMKSWKKKKNAKAADAAATGAQASPNPQAGLPVAGGAHPGAYGGPSAQIMPQVVGGQAYQGVPGQPQMQRPGMPGQPMPMRAPAAGQPQAPRPQSMPAPRMPQPMPQQGMPQQGMPQPMPQQGVPQQGMPHQAMPPQGVPAPQMPQMGQPHLTSQHAPMGGHQAPLAAARPPEVKREEGEVALPAISVHAFCERPETAGAVQATTRDWRMARTNVKVYMGGLPSAVDFYRNETTPNLILIESGMRGEELFGQLESLAAVCDAGTKVVVIGATNDIRLYRDLMDKGVSDYLVPPFHPLTLIRSMSDIYVDPEKPFTGRVTAFFGAKGGVGSSTLAHNIAWMLSTAHNQETALVDLDASWGTTGLDFNYDNVQGLEEALASPDRLDETLLDRIMLRHTEKLSLLPAAASLNNAGMENKAAFEAVVSGIRKISPLSILDMPHYWTDWTSQTLIGADDVVVTATPDLANLRNTKNLLEFLRSERPNDPDPILILNKTNVPKTPEIPIKDFAAAVGLTPSLVLPYEPVLYAQASNDGKMISEMKSDSRAVDGFTHIAQRLKTGSFEPSTKMLSGKSSGSLLSKFKKKK